MFKSLYVLMMLGLLELSQAQRPSFAGLRPPGGLSQKDKYHATQNTAVENITGVDIATRFGEDAVPQQTQTVSLAYGASQKPPVGVPLVLPISSYVPNVASVPATASTTTTTATAATATFSPSDVANRFGGSTVSANPPVSSSGVNFRPVAAPARPPPPNALPIDAHGDQDYVNHLSQLPVDNQPFWFINYQAIEALRNSSRPNVGALETRGSFFAG